MNRFIRSIVLCILLISCYAEGARKPHEIRPGRFEDVDRFDEIYYIVRNSLLLLVAPCIFSLLLALYRDPATPLVAKAAWRMLKGKLLGNLSAKSDAMKV